MKTILLVEDNPDDEELTRYAFRKSNVVNQIVVAHDGQEALDMLFGPEGPEKNRDLRLRPSVILLDLKLPKVGGLDVLRRIRSDPRSQCLPVIVLTSSREQEDLIASYQLGCNSYVRKPVNFLEFVEAARQLGLYWLLLNESPTTR
jgi:CheY-like chemotaxis protein